MVAAFWESDSGGDGSSMNDWFSIFYRNIADK
jgi:hypothetical protein